MTSAVCTLYEGDYHYGVGVLTNSLYNHGFRGVMWVGYRGNLPFWAKSLRNKDGYQEFSIAEDCVMRFVNLTTTKHLAYYKPDFMWQLLENYCPEVDALCYFDPDIVNKLNWEFYQNWFSRGIALCGDSWFVVPANHPKRLAWKEFALSNGFDCERELDFNYNSGFIGIPRSYKSLLLLWQKLIEIGTEAGYSDIKDFTNRDYDGYPYLDTDQTYFNLALMLNSYPLSTVGPEGMDFLPGGNIMSHAASPKVKPWRKKLIFNALNGNGPNRTDKLYWKHSQAPIQMYSPTEFRWNKFALRFGSGIGRLIRRAPI